MPDFFTNDEMTDFSHEQRAVLRRYWLRNYADNFKRLPTDKDIRSLPDLLFGKPVIVMGAAPVEESAYEAIRSLKGVATIVCCDKALPRIISHVRPDFVVALNTRRTPDVKLEEWFADSEGIGLIVPLTVHPDTPRLWKGDVYWMNPSVVDPDLQMRFEQETGLQPWSRGINVGEFALHMGAFVRPAEIALFGMWYAWRTREDVVTPDTDLTNYDCVELVDHGERYWTNVIWLSSRAGFMTICKDIHTQGMGILNCSEGGILYHPEHCVRTSPADFATRWLDTPVPPSCTSGTISREKPDVDADYGGD